MAALPPRAADAPNVCVLLLEDDDADAYLTVRALRSIPSVDLVIRARDGREAIAMLQSGGAIPDIAFVDLQMPTMDGLEFLQTCMDRAVANIPMIVLTSSSDWKDALRSRVQGASLVISKPEEPDDLRGALQEAIETFVPRAVAFPPQPNKALFDPPQQDVPIPPRVVGVPAMAAPPFGRRPPRMAS